jgi:hypothetical protein
MNGKSKAKTVEEYMTGLPEERKGILERVHRAITQAVPGLEPHMMAGMIGYGTYHYKYASGREGDWSLIALANQKNYISIYICAVEDGKYLAESSKDRLGKVSVGRSCIRFKKPEDINSEVLTELCKKAETLGKAGNFSM